MYAGKRPFGVDDGSPDLFGLADYGGSPSASGPWIEVNAARPLILPVKPNGLTEVQLTSYVYAPSGQYGSNFVSAWRYASGGGVAVALVDDGFDPATTATYAGFSASSSRNFGPGAAGDVREPVGGFHGTRTSGMIGATGINGTPMGLAPNATIVGVKVGFGAASLISFAQAEAYAASAAAVVNNSWGFNGFGVGEPNAAGFGVWYGAVRAAVQYGRGGLGSILVFAAGNDRQSANSLAVQPISADYRAIAVAATNQNGTVAYYSTSGAGLLVAAIGDNVAVANPGGFGSGVASGTSYAAPTVSAVAALMLQVNPNLGWRDVQAILAFSAYAPPPSAGGFVTNGAAFWNGGGLHFSNDLGFGVIDANVAVNLARAWTLQSTSANLAGASPAKFASFSVGIGATVASTLAVTASILVQHVQVTIDDTYMPVADTRLVLISPNGTRSVLLNQTGLVNGRDLTGGLDVSGDVITSNAFWGENAAGTWTLQIQDIGGRMIGTVRDWYLTVLGDNATVAEPLVYTPEFAAIAAASASRTVVTPGSAATIDLIALPGATAVNLNGGGGSIDGVAVTVQAGLRNANADGSTGSVTLTGLAAGGSELTGGDTNSVLNGAGGDTINAGLGTTAINTGRGGSTVTLSSLGASQVTIASGGGDTIWAGLATVSVTDTGARGDTIVAQSGTLTFINGSGASSVSQGSGTVMIQGGAGGGVYYAGTGGNSRLTAGAGLVTLHGAANGDVLTAAGAAADVLIAGAGAETLSGGAATGNLILIGGSGSDIMTAGQGRTTFIVGTGNDSITVGGVADIIQIQAGAAGGLDTISGFRIGTDFLRLIGFASSMAAAAVASETPDGFGGTMVRLSDNTRLDLLGLSAVGKTAFA